MFVAVLQASFPQVYMLDIDEDVNHVLFALKTEWPQGKQLDGTAKAEKILLPHFHDLAVREWPQSKEAQSMLQDLYLCAPQIPCTVSVTAS